MASSSMIMMMTCYALCLFVVPPLGASGQVSPPSPVSLTPTPAPAPGPVYVNLTELLSRAGPFSTFLRYLESTKVIDTFQNQANNTDQGVTIFVPKDDAFKAANKRLANLTSNQLRSLFLFHALPQFYSLASFKNLSKNGPTNTFAGGQYTLNFIDASGTVRLDSGWSKTKVSSAVFSTYPVAVYQVDKVMLPEAIFGTDIPPTPAPAPTPDVGPAADAPSKTKAANADSSSSTNSSPRMINLGIWTQLLLAISAALLFL